MRTLRTNAGFAAALALLFLSACAIEVREPLHEADGPYAADLYAPEAAPAPQSDVIVGVAPGPEYVWVGGYWTRHHDQWYWVHGRWAARPHGRTAWENGHWERHPDHHYVWRNGHWR